MTEEKDFIEVCSAYTDALFKCQSDNKDYFEAFQRALSDSGTDDAADTDIEDESNSETVVTNSDSDKQNLDQDNSKGEVSADTLLSDESLSSTSSSSSKDQAFNSTSNANAAPDSMCRLEESEEERQYWESKKVACGFCAFCLDSPCAEYFKPWSRCIDKTEEGRQ
jgi:hypothetical protein